MVTHGTGVREIHLDELTDESEHRGRNHEPRRGTQPSIESETNKEKDNDASCQLRPLGHAAVESHWLRLGEKLQERPFRCPDGFGTL